MTTETQLNPWVKRANAIACGILVIAIAYLLVKLVYLFVDPSASQPAPSLYGTSAGGAQPLAARQEINTASIPHWNLFGSQTEAAPEVSDEVEAPETRLNLELQAVFVSPEEDRSSAMVAEARKDSQLFRVGDKISNGVTLAAVFPNRILISRNGAIEALFFPESAGGAMTRAGEPEKPAVDRPSRRAASRSGDASSRMDAVQRARSSRMSSSQVSERMLGQLQEQVRDNPDQVLGQFGLAQNGGSGYRVAAGGNPMLATLGVKPGDVIVSVNGRSLGDPTQDVDFMNEVMQSGSVQVTIERDGRQFETQVSMPGF